MIDRDRRRFLTGAIASLGLAATGDVDPARGVGPGRLHPRRVASTCTIISRRRHGSPR